MNWNDRESCFAGLIKHGMRPYEAGKAMGLSHGQTSRVWQNLKDGKRGAPPRPFMSAGLVLPGPPVPVDQIVARDTCPRCGARSDYGCGHRPVAGGRLLV